MPCMPCPVMSCLTWQVVNDDEQHGQRVERLFLCPRHEAACVERLEGAADQSVILLKSLLWEALRDAEAEAKKATAEGGRRAAGSKKRFMFC